MSPHESPTLFADEDALLRELEALAPRPDPAFAAALDERVEAGFPEVGDDAAAATSARSPRRRRAGWLRWPRSPLVLSGGVAVLAAAVFAVVLVNGQDGVRDVSGTYTEQAGAVLDESARSASGTAEPGADSAASTAAAAPATTLSGTSPGGTASGGDAGGERRVERSAQLTIAVRPREFAAAAAKVPQIAAGARAIVDRSQVSTGTGNGADAATFELRVPVGRLDATLAQLSELGTVTARDESGFDITGTVVAAEDRLGDLRAERDSVRLRLARETDDARADDLRTQLATLRRQIAEARGAAVALQQRTSYARVTLALEARNASSGAAAADDERGPIAGALHAAGDALEAIAAVLIVVLAVGIPLLLALALLWRGGSALRRRRREAGLA